jgi:hypothetical protein
MSTAPETSFAPSASASAIAFGFHCVLPKQDFAQAVAKVTEIDVQAAMKAKLGIERRCCR